MNSIDPSIWGNDAWNFLEHIVSAYPTNPTNIDKQNMKNFFTYLGLVLPCEKCRYNYKTHLNNVPMNAAVLSSKDNLFNWLTQIHNKINVMNNKPIISYNDALIKYANKKNKNKNGSIMFLVPYINIFVTGILFMVVMYMIMLKK